VIVMTMFVSTAGAGAAAGGGGGGGGDDGVGGSDVGGGGGGGGGGDGVGYAGDRWLWWLRWRVLYSRAASERTTLREHD
jgi:hypothetical protein